MLAFLSFGSGGKIVCAVHSPAIKHSDRERIFGASERTFRAHNAVVAEHEFSVLVGYVMFGASVYALHAVNAFALVDFEKSAVYFHGDVFDSEHPCDECAERNTG